NAVRNDKHYRWLRCRSGYSLGIALCFSVSDRRYANSVFRPGGRREPHSVGRRGAQRNGAGGGGECKRLIVVARQDPQLGAGPDAAVRKEFEQAASAFIDSADRVIRMDLRLGEQHLSAAAAAGAAF